MLTGKNTSYRVAVDIFTSTASVFSGHGNHPTHKDHKSKYKQDGGN
jgi:hypothetical protein